jgi:hypothetical protein
VLWLLVLGWALGACVLVFAFAVGVGARKFGLAIVLFVVGVVVVGASTIAGNRHNAQVHGIRPDEPPEFMTPGGS